MTCQFVATDLSGVMAALVSLRHELDRLSAEVSETRAAAEASAALSRNISDRMAAGLPIVDGRVGPLRMSGKVQG